MYHVGLEQHALKEDVVVGQSLEHSGVHLLSHLLAHFDRVAAVGEDFWLHDGGESVFLANGGVSSQTPSVFLNRLFSRAVLVYLQDSSPLTESTA